MKRWHTLLVVGVAGAGWVGAAGPLHAEEAGQPESASPADTPTPDASRVRDKGPGGLDALIRQLGAADFREREAAVAKLKRVGAPALAALKRARASDDPEVASRADSVIRHLERPPVPARLPGARGGGGGFGRGGFGGGGVDVRVRMSVENGVRRVEVEERGRTVRIDEGPNGIEMAVTGQQDGKEVTRDFRARTPDELRKQHPEAFDLYDRWAGRGARNAVKPGGRFDDHVDLLRPRRGIGGMGPRPEEWQPPLPEPALPADELAELRDLMLRQMNDADVPDARRQEVLGLLDRLRGMRGGGGGEPLADEDEAHRRMDAFNRGADALRDRVKDLALPDPGAALPPPAGTRLGVTVIEDPDEGLTVVHVMPDGRAERVGVEPLDVIKTVNGKAVADARALRRAVTEAKPPLVIEGTRDGEAMRLEEKIEPEPGGTPHE